MNGASYEARQSRVEALLRRMGAPSSIFQGDAFDIWIYPDLVGPGVESLFSVGLSHYLLPGYGDANTVGYELHLIGEPGQDAFKEALFEGGEILLERYSDHRQPPAPGDLLASDALRREGRQGHWSLSALIIGWSVWLPEHLALDRGSDVDGPLLFLDLTPVTQAEASLFRLQHDRFEQLTGSGQIDLLDFRRSNNDQIAGS